MEKTIMDKSLLKKILFIAWIAVCTAIFIYFVVELIQSIDWTFNVISRNDLQADTELISGMKIKIVYLFFYLFFIIVFYISFLALSVPKILQIVHPLSVKNVLVHKILLIAWTASCTAIFIYFIVDSLQTINSIFNLISQHNLESDAEIMADMKNSIMNTKLFLVLEAILYASFLILSIPKLQKAFRPLPIKDGIDKPSV